MKNLHELKKKKKPAQQAMFQRCHIRFMFHDTAFSLILRFESQPIQAGQELNLHVNSRKISKMISFMKIYYFYKKYCKFFIRRLTVSLCGWRKQCCQIQNFKKDQTFALNDQICDQIIYDKFFSLSHILLAFYKEWGIFPFSLKYLLFRIINSKRFTQEKSKYLCFFPTFES